MIKATLEERKKLFVAVLITFFMTIFWGFHELSGSVITLFAFFLYTSDAADEEDSVDFVCPLLFTHNTLR